MRKGFTLVELLAVITILAIIALIATPIILNIIEDYKNQSYIISAENYVRAVEQALYSENLEDEFTPSECIVIKNGNIKCGEKEIKVNVSGNKPKEGTLLLNDNEVKKSLNLQYDEKVYVNKELGEDYYIEDEYIPVAEVYEGLYPVIYDEEEKLWKIVDEYSKWYDYKKQEWANAVILNDNVSKEPGTIIYPDGENINIKAMFVWIPRYSYTIGNTYGVQLEGGDTPSQATPGAIDIKFVDKNTKENGIAAYKGDSPTEWRTHPAFTFGSQELSGIWVGKFETSHISGTKSLTCTNENCTDADSLRILPNVVSLNNNTVSKFFFATRSMTREGNPFKLNSSTTDSHMMKNSEWGAVAYLSQSKYGKYGNPKYEGANKEIYQNRSSSYITGSSNGTPSQSSTKNPQYTYDVELNGTGASTTGTIYGVYDMSGGAYEYVMGYLTDAYISSSNPWGSTSSKNLAGFMEKLEDKYFDGYTGTSVDKACNEGICYGHALSETSGWYGDSAIFVSSILPWFMRGGSCVTSLSGGVFYFYYYNGNIVSNYSFRVVLAPTS